MSDSHESSGNIERAVFFWRRYSSSLPLRGETLEFLTERLVCLLCKPVLLTYILSTSRLGSSLGPRHLRSLYPWVRLPVGGVPVSGIVHMRSYLPVTPVGWDHNHTFSQPVFLSLPSFQTNDEDRSFGEQWVYPTSRVLYIVRWRIVLWTFLWNLV